MNADLETLAAAVERLTGIATDPRRFEPLSQRLAPVIAAHGLSDARALASRLAQPGAVALAKAVTEAVVINETLFFRDRTPFEAFRIEMLGRMLAARSRERRLRVWSAACSTGQEPYSLAMLLDDEAARLHGWRIELLATDISQAALDVGRRGVYSHFEAQRGLSTRHLLRHFHKHGDGWRVSDALRASVSFGTRNLLADFAALGAFDVIFCRNVLMYMDVACRRAILARLAASLATDGYLVLGAAETMVGLSDAFAPLEGRPSVFVRRAAH